jgi:deoxyribonuclease-4
MGKDTKNYGKERAFQNMVDNVNYILSNLSNFSNLFPVLILETAVKTKNDICKFSTIEGLASLYKALGGHSKIKFCIDTCHVFASGYDLSTKQGFDSFIDKFDKLIGIQHIVLFHLNDSKMPLNSGVDRHAPLTEGYIFKDNESTLKYIINFCIKQNISVITETDQPLLLEYTTLTRILNND